MPAYKRPKALMPMSTGYCPGCLHALATRLVADVIGELEQEKNAVPEIRAPYDTDVYCVTCNKTVHVKSGEVVPFCCGRLMEILD